MKSYKVIFENDPGSFHAQRISDTVGGDWRDPVCKFNGEHDLCFFDVPDDSAEYLEEILDADENVIRYTEREISNAAAILGRKGGSVKSGVKTAAVRNNAQFPRPRRYTHAAHYKGGIAYLQESFDLHADYKKPKSHKARFGDRWVRVIVDHEATGTAAPGTGDTIVRSIAKGWKSGGKHSRALEL